MARFVMTEEERKKMDQQLMYKNRVVELIREGYSINDEIALIIKSQSDDPNDVEEYNKYRSYVEYCKLQARKEVGV